MPDVRWISSLLLSVLAIASATTVTFPPAFLRDLRSAYDLKVESFFPSSALNSTVELNSFLLDLPSIVNASDSGSGDDDDDDVCLYSRCNNSSADECLARLPPDPRSQIIILGDFLSREGQLEDLENTCVAKVAPVLVRESSDAARERARRSQVECRLKKKKNMLATVAPNSGQPIRRGPPLATSIGYGVLFVTIISFCSFGGAFIMPFIDTGCYKKCLMWMVGLAVGTLSGSGLLHLMPHAFGMTPDELGLGYLYRASMIFGGIYLFFVVERFLRSVESWRRKRHDAQRRLRHVSCASHSEDECPCPEGDCVENRESPEVEYPPLCSIHAPAIPTNEGADMKVPHIKSRTPKQSESNQALKSHADENSDESNLKDVIVIVEDKSNGMMPNGKMSNGVHNHGYSGHDHHGHSHDLPLATGGTSDIATVAWMVIFGDGLHNFIDGLSIGAAFTESILSGISISVAVICEEFPHELGDFAILLNSGMKFKQALMYNFMSACMCYIGLIFGIILGDTTESAQWIFALAAGMFLYISLVNMVPELNQQAEEMSKSGTPTWLVLILQHSGIILGFIIMYLMAAYGGEIDFS